MLSAVNDVFSGSRVNVDAQFLQTRGSIGYVVIDIDADAQGANAMRQQLAALPGTLRTRLLY